MVDRVHERQSGRSPVDLKELTARLQARRRASALEELTQEGRTALMLIAQTPALAGVWAVGIEMAQAASGDAVPGMAADVVKRAAVARAGIGCRGWRGRAPGAWSPTH